MELSSQTPEQISETKYFGLQSNPVLYDGSHQVWTDAEAQNMVIMGDASYILGLLDAQSVDMIFTCPAPYSAYQDVVIGPHKQRFVGAQSTPNEYLLRLLEVMVPCYRVLKDSGHLWIDLPDVYDDTIESYLGIPETFFLSMIYGSAFDDEKWHAADKPLWHRSYDPTVMVPDQKKRMKRDWEHVFHFTKTKNQDCYWKESPKEWYGKSSILSAPLDYEKEESKEIESGYPEKVIEAAIKLSCPPDGTVLDCMSGTGTVAKVAQRLNRRFIMIDLAQTASFDCAKRFKLKEVQKK